MSRLNGLATLLLAGAACMTADFSYQETAKITGGLMAGAMKVAAVFSKQAREPIRSTIYLKGNRMGTLSSAHGHIIDLDQETITEIDFDKKTYSVTTFAEIADTLRQAQAGAAPDRSKQSDVTVKASARATGQTKTISGLPAREVIITVEMEGTDESTGQRGVFLTVTSDMWLADVPGYQEVTAFYQRMAQKLAWMPSMQAMGPQSANLSRGMAELYKEASKLNGLAVYQTIKMGMPAQASEASQRRREARPTAQQPEEQPSVGGALGRLGGLGRLGRLGRKKEAEPPRTTEPATPEPADTSGALMEMVTEASGFSTAPVDPTRLAVPAGFKQVESNLRRGMRR